MPTSKKTATKSAAKEKTAKKATATKKAPAKKAPAKKTTKKAAAKTSAQTKVLTDNQLRRMPKKDYMNQAQLIAFKERLLALKEETLEHVEHVKEELRNFELEIDPQDRATREENQALNLRIVDRELKLVKKIDSALARIHDGTYGWCEQTGESIGIERLLLRPTATLSIDAKQMAEGKERHFADHRD